MSTSEYYEYYKVCNENLRQKPNLITKQAADIYNIYKHIHSSDIWGWTDKAWYKINHLSTK